MKVVKPIPTSRGLARGLLLGALALLLGWPLAAWAYVPGVEELCQRLAAHALQLNSAIVDTQTTVYPWSPAGAASGAAQPKDLPQQAFRQRIYWQRGGVLAVETLAQDGTLLDVQLQEGFRPLRATLSPQRPFALADVHPALFPFLEGTADAWRRELVFWGVQPVRVDLAYDASGIFFRLGQGAGQALWLDTQDLLPLRLETQIGGGEASAALTIEFSAYMSANPRRSDAADQRIPRTMRYYLQGRLFRQTEITALQADAPVRGFPLARLRQLVGASGAAAPWSLAGGAQP